jgi:hypothetical protein
LACPLLSRLTGRRQHLQEREISRLYRNRRGVSPQAAADRDKNVSMLWIAWIVCAIVFAVLFSVIKTLDRLNYSVELVHARLDQMSASIAELVVSVNALTAHQAAAHLEAPAARFIERSAGH